MEEQNQDQTEGQAKLQSRPLKAVRDLWNKYCLMSILHQPAVVWSLLPPPHPKQSSVVGHSGKACPQPFRKGMTSAECNPKGADSFRLSAGCFPHSYTARPSLKVVAQDYPTCHSNVSHKRISVFSQLCYSYTDFLSQKELTQKSLYFTSQLTHHTQCMLN